MINKEYLDFFSNLGNKTDEKRTCYLSDVIWVPLDESYLNKKIIKQKHGTFGLFKILGYYCTGQKRTWWTNCFTRTFQIVLNTCYKRGIREKKVTLVQFFRHGRKHVKRRKTLQNMKSKRIHCAPLLHTKKLIKNRRVKNERVGRRKLLEQMIESCALKRERMIKSGLIKHLWE